jgi:thiol-disulfide isomerase/thioredoxin
MVQKVLIAGTERNVGRSLSKLFGAFGLSLATLLLSSCAFLGPVATTSEPETSIAESPPASAGVKENPGAYIDYGSYATSSDQYADTEVVLFFNAVWCSTCKQARDNFEASLSEIPEYLTIVLVDFDDSIELRKKYGVTVQHTFVQIDRTGDAVGKWSGSVTVAQIVGKLS